MTAASRLATALAPDPRDPVLRLSKPHLPEPAVEFNPTPAQWKAINSNAPITILIMGTGTGKTIAGRYWLARQVYERSQLALDDDQRRAIVFSPSFPSFTNQMKRGAIPFLTDKLHWGKWNKGDKTVDLDPRLGGGAVFFKSGREPLSAEGIHASLGVWIDEPGQTDGLTWQVAYRRAALAGAPILLTGYPLSGTGWYRDLYDRGVAGDPNILIIKGKTEDVPWYNKESLAEARANNPPWLYSMIYEAEFTRALGAIYPPAIIREIPPEVRARLQTYGGADYGLNTAAVTFGFDDDVCYVLAAYKGYDLPTQTHAAAMKGLGFTRNELNAGDPSARQGWKDYAAEGIKIRLAIGGPGSVDAGIARLFSMVMSGKLIFDAKMPGLAMLLNEWDTYHRHTDADGLVIGTAPVKDNDHILDALRYGITTARPAKMNFGGVRFGRSAHAGPGARRSRLSR